MSSTRSPGKSPRITGKSIRKEMKDTLAVFPELLDIVTPEASPSSFAKATVEDHFKEEIIELQGTNDAQVGSLSPKERSSSQRRQKRTSNPQKEKDDDDEPSSDDVQNFPSVSDGDDDADLPQLIDDSTHRVDLGGKKGEKSWNIREDTPGGHTLEKFAIVTGVEGYDSMDEDDDILDDDEIHGDDALQDSTTLMSPKNAKQDTADKETQRSNVDTKFPVDRFSAACQNSEAWKSTGLESSQVFSIYSEQLAGEDADTISDLATTITDTDDRTLTNHTFETFMLEQDCQHQIVKAETTVKSITPVTLKRAGGRRSGESTSPSFPALQDERAHGKEPCHPAVVPEDDFMDMNDAIDSESPLSSPAARIGSNSTGRSSSSRLRSSAKSSRRGRRTRPVMGNMLPAVVSSIASPGDLSPSVGRSLLTCSIMSSPTMPSITSSGKLLTPSIQNVPEVAPLKNRTLQGFVGREFSTPGNDDDHTLGASTITTNFSATQRTSGDNTISTRSLFRTGGMPSSDMMRMPQRRTYDSDVEEESTGSAPGAPTPSPETVTGSVEQVQALKRPPVERSNSSKRGQNKSLSESLDISPRSREKLKKKRSKQNLFGRMTSWKGLVAKDATEKQMLEE
ncbi:MAG: hypothetical protein SGILL_008429 [Bacillariaceae sp.]